MLRLLTLGGVAVVNESGDDVGSATTQRRTLAVLSILAVAGPTGVSRQRLVTLLWPDADLDRGRHALTQALYASRRSLACDDLFCVDGDIKLRGDRMTSDVGDLDNLLSLDPEAAAALYRGPFLDGFLFPGSAEFERWSATQRVRIENQIVHALRRLATGTKDPSCALRWWKRAAALRPLDGEIALQLMQTLAESGDRAGALKHAAIHSALLREELELDPDRSVTDLVRLLRESSPKRPLVDGTARAATTPVREPLLAPAKTSNRGSSRSFLWAVVNRPMMWWPIVAALVIAVTTIGTVWSHRRTVSLSTLPLRHRVIVAPFRVAGADPSLAYLRDGIVELLTARLAGEARSTDAGAVLGAWRATGISPDMDVPRNTVVQLASRLRAERVVVGGVVGAPRHIVIRATMLRVPAATVVSQAIVEGPADSVATLIGRLADELLAVGTAATDGAGGRSIAVSPARSAMRLRARF